MYNKNKSEEQIEFERNQLFPVDTVCITLDKGSFELQEERLKGFRGIRGLFCRAASKEEKRQGFYRPTICLNANLGTCRIVASLPKLLNGENLQELTIADENAIYAVLRTYLADSGINTNEENLSQASLSRMDIGKNINLTGHGSAFQVLDLFKRCQISGRKRGFDITYANGGRSLRIRNASSDYILYDKLLAPEMCGISEKLSPEPEQYCQKALFKMLSEDGYQVLRIERRFCGKALKALFQEYGIRRPQFGDIFDPEIGYNLFQFDWKRLAENCVFPDQKRVDKLSQVIEFLKKKTMGSLRNTLAYCMLQELLDTYSLEDLRQTFRLFTDIHNVRNFFEQVKEWNAQTSPKPDVLKAVSEQIEEWNPLRLPLTPVAKN